MKDIINSPESPQEKFEAIRAKFRRVVTHPLIPQPAHTDLLKVVDAAQLLTHDQFLTRVLASSQGKSAHQHSSVNILVANLRASCTPDNHIFFDEQIFTDPAIPNPFVVFAEEVAHGQARPEYQVSLSEAVQQPMLIYPFTAREDLLSHLDKMRALRGHRAKGPEHEISIAIKGFKSALYDGFEDQRYVINPVHNGFEEARASLVKAALVNIYCGPLNKLQLDPPGDYILGQKQAIAKLRSDPFMNEVHRLSFAYLDVISKHGSIGPEKYVGELLQALSTYTMQSFMDLLVNTQRSDELSIFKSLVYTFTRNWSSRQDQKTSPGSNHQPRPVMPLSQ